MSPNKNEWLEYAKMDIDTAEHMYKSFYPQPLQIICFHCQQTAEKSIKAIIIAKQIPTGLPKSHDLEFLLQQIKNYTQIHNKFWNYAEELSPYGIQARYPNNNMEFTIENTKQAIKYAKEIYKWALNELENL